MAGSRRKGRRWRAKRRRVRDNTEVFRSQASDPSFVQLRQWMSRGGFKGCHLDPAFFHNTGRGLRATRTINAGDTVISIPTRLLVTTATVLDSYLGPLIKSETPPLTAVQILGVFLVCERARGAASPWYPYVQVLPTAYTNATHWEPSDLQLLPERLLQGARSQMEKVARSFQLLQGFIGVLEARWPGLRGAVTMEAYRWAWSGVNTRSVYMKQPRCVYVSDREVNHYALAPLLDLLNHSASAQVRATFNVASQCYEIMTDVSYVQHSEVFISYGPHDNHTLLTEYGFTLSANPHSVVLFDLDDIRKVADHFAIDEYLRRRDILVENALCHEDGLSWMLLTALRIICLDHDQLNHWKVVLSGDVVTPTVEALVKEMARHLLNTAAASLKMDAQVAPATFFPLYQLSYEGKFTSLEHGSSFNYTRVQVHRTPQSSLIVGLRDEQLGLVMSNLTQLDPNTG